MVSVELTMAGSKVSFAPVDSEIASQVLIVSYGSPEYSRELREIVPDGAVPPSLASILPFSAILRNVSSQSIIMTGLVFEVEGVDGRTPQYSLVTLDLAPSSSAHLQPNQRRFVSFQAMPTASSIPETSTG